MTANEIVEAVLNGFRIFISWPILAFVLILLFRKQIGDLLPALVDRIESISIAGNNVIFNNKLQGYPTTELQEQVRLRTLESSLRTPESDLIEGEDYELEGPTSEVAEPISRGELDESGETQSSDIDEWEQTLDDLENR